MQSRRDLSRIYCSKRIQGLRDSRPYHLLSQ
nr:MAG TPA: hypothetical protein [Bacteriophage sp.]